LTFPLKTGAFAFLKWIFLSVFETFSDILRNVKRGVGKKTSPAPRRDTNGSASHNLPGQVERNLALAGQTVFTDMSPYYLL